MTQVINSKESYLSCNAIKEEINSMSFNRVYDLIESPNGVKVINVHGPLRQRKAYWVTLKDIKPNSLLKDSLKRNEPITRIPFLLY